MNEDLIKIAFVILVFAFFAVMLKSYRPEYAMLLTVAVSVSVIITLVKKVFPSVATLISLYKSSGGSGYNLSVALKALVVAYLVNFCAETCRDYGQNSLALKAEFAGKCAIFIMSVPLITSVIDAAIDFSKI